MDILERTRQGIVLFDGAMGTQIQARALPDEAFDGREGCNEVLNLTAPDEIEAIHAAYFEAGSDVVETNTFGGSALVLAEYQLEGRTEEINAAAARAARRAAQAHSSERPRFVAGSMGPGTKLASLGQAPFDTLYRSYLRQAEGLLEGEVDLFLIETCQDPLQIKSCLLAARDAMTAAKVWRPLAVTVTVETSGTLLVGTEIDAVLAILAPFEPDLFGMNCATGPEPMRPYVRRICQRFDGPVLVQPNAGLPRNEGGRVVYPLEPEPFAAALEPFITEEGVGLVGGCCGTTPEHISELAARARALTPAPRTSSAEPTLASLFGAQPIAQDPAPFLVGERANANGSKVFRKKLLADDWEGVVAVARAQERSAHGIDLCVASAGRDERADMREAVSRVARQVTLPLFIDSTDLGVIEEALELYGGRAVINSVNLEAGEERAEAICRLAKRYGAALVALTIDEQGMALEVERKLEVARRLHQIAVERCGLRSADLLFDTLTFTLGSGDATLRDAGVNTLEALRQVKAALPGVHTLLGVSNISFGLNPASREVLNSVFLAEAVKAGLDAAIVNSRKILPLYQIDEEDRRVALDVIYDRGEEGASLRLFIEHFAARAGTPRRAEADDQALSLDDKIKRRVVDGQAAGIEALLEQKRAEAPALEIINGLLIPAMQRVGELFGAGEMQLPFVLQAAEVMKKAVGLLEPFLDREDKQEQAILVLATVRGDVHDIGKNLVDIILSNNGYKVHNLGINCEIATLADKAEEVGADVIGMSGLLVKSTVVMRENLQELARRGLGVPVLLGGAALTGDYVDDHCAPELEAPVVYCADAFAGLDAMRQLQAGTLADATAAQAARRRARARPKPRAAREEAPEEVRRDIAVPTPPFWGRRLVDDVGLSEAYAYLNETVLIRGRWGYRRGKLAKETFERQLAEEVRPTLEALKRRCADEQLLQPRLVYGYFPCNSEGDEVVIYHPDTSDAWVRLRLPRQRKQPNRSIADFFLPAGSGQRDLIALQVVTVGARASEETQRLFAADSYKDYLLLHGLSVEVAEALAELWHRRVREELGILEQEGEGIADFVTQGYRGSRYSFGYPACPDIEENRKLFEVLEPEEIGVTLTETGQMEPEQTTSAFIVHHPQAKYFTLS